MAYYAAPNIARTGVVAGFVLSPQYSITYDSVVTVVGYDPETGDPIEVTTEVPRRVGSRVPLLTTGVLFAQGTMWRPTSAPAVLEAPADALMWLHYNTSTGLYWLNSTTPMTAGDALLGWVRTNATEIVAMSVEVIGDTALEAVRVAPVQSAGPQIEAPATFPDAPTPAGFTAALSYPADTDNYVASGTVTLGTDVEHLQQVQVVGVDGSGRDVAWATLYGPFTAEAVLDWQSAQLPRPGAALTLTPECFGVNENSRATRPGRTAGAVTIAAGGGTTIYTPPTPPDNPLTVTLAEVTSGGVPVHTIDLANQLTSVDVDVTITLAGGNTAEWFWLEISPDNGTTWDQCGRFPVGAAARVRRLCPVVADAGTADWKARCYTGNAAGGDNTPSTATVSASTAVNGVRKPLATGCSGGSVAAAVNVVDADGAQDWYVPAVTIQAPGESDPDAWLLKLTFRCTDASGVAAPAEQGGTEVEFCEWANDGAIHSIDIGNWGYNPVGSVYHYGEIRAYVGRRTAEGESALFSDTATHTLQTACWPGGLAYKRFDFGEAPAGQVDASRLRPSTVGRGLTVGDQLRTAVAGQNLVPNYSFDDELAHWEVRGTETVPYLSDAADARYRGLYGVSVQGSATAVAAASLWTPLAEAWPVSPGEVWCLRFRYRWNYANGPVNCGLVWWDKDRGYLDYTPVVLTPESVSAWKVSGPTRMPVPAGASWCTVQIACRLPGSGFTGGWWSFDDVEVWRAADATAVDPATISGLEMASGKLRPILGLGMEYGPSGEVRPKILSGSPVQLDGSGNFTIPQGALTQTQMGPGVVVRTEATAPTLPSATYPAGSMYFNLTDGYVYRTQTGLAGSWTKAVRPEDLIAGSIAASVAYLGTVNASQVNAGEFNGHTLYLLLNGIETTVKNQWSEGLSDYVGVGMRDMRSGTAGYLEELSLTPIWAWWHKTGSTAYVKVSRTGIDLYNGTNLTQITGAQVATPRVQTGEARIAGQAWADQFYCGYSGYAFQPLRLGLYYFWLDYSNRLRVKVTAPAAADEGLTVGTQQSVVEVTANGALSKWARRALVTAAAAVALTLEPPVNGEDDGVALDIVMARAVYGTTVTVVSGGVMVAALRVQGSDYKRATFGGAPGPLRMVAYQGVWYVTDSGSWAFSNP